jgi:hypothetical protein
MATFVPVLNIGSSFSHPEPLHRNFIVYVVFTSIQRNVRDPPHIEVHGIFRSGFNAKCIAREWVEAKQEEYNGHSYCVMDERYERGTRGRCVKWSTPEPYLDGRIFRAWTHRQMIHIEDVDNIELEENKFPLPLFV